MLHRENVLWWGLNCIQKTEILFLTNFLVRDTIKNRDPWDPWAQITKIRNKSWQFSKKSYWDFLLIFSDDKRKGPRQSDKKNKFSVFCMIQIPPNIIFKWCTYYKNRNQKLGLTHGPWHPRAFLLKNGTFHMMEFRKRLLRP